MATDIRLKETELQTVTDRLVDTYTSCNTLNHLGHEPLPSRDAVAAIVADIFEVLYPGYGRKQSLHIGNVGYYVGTLVDSLHDQLTEQIARALRHGLARALRHRAGQQLGLRVHGRPPGGQHRDRAVVQPLVAGGEPRAPPGRRRPACHWPRRRSAAGLHRS